jgi:O-antigen ligase
MSTADVMSAGPFRAGTTAQRPIIPARYFRVPRAALAAFIVLAAIAVSPIVFTEPAPVDALLMGAIVALPLLAQTRPGPIATTILALMFVNVACAFVIAPASFQFAEGVRHQVITIYLLLAGFVLAGYIAMDPARRADRVMVVYVLAAAVASALALIGFFGLIPGSSELFTLFGRARGTFKDPNVLGAAIAPAFVWLLWSVANAPLRKAKWSLLGLVIIGAAMLLSFSRGAWLSAFVSAVFMSAFIAASLKDQRLLSRFVFRFLPALLLFPVAMLALMQIETVREMAEVRFRLDQSYDSGPYGRFGGQAIALDLTLQNPFGIGTFGFGKYHIEDPHNVYLTMFLAAGWIGGLAYIAAILLTLAAGIFHAIAPGPTQRLQILATAAFLGLAVQGFIIDTDHWRHFFIVQALVVGLADAALRQRALDRAEQAMALQGAHAGRADRVARPPVMAVADRRQAAPASAPVREKRPKRRGRPAPGPTPAAPIEPARRVASANRSYADGMGLADRLLADEAMERDVTQRPKLGGLSQAEIAARASHGKLAAILEGSRWTTSTTPPSELEIRLNQRGPLEKSGMVSATHQLRRRIERDFAA